MKIFKRHNKTTESIVEEGDIIGNSQRNYVKALFKDLELFQSMIKIGSLEGMKNQKKYYP